MKSLVSMQPISGHVSPETAYLTFNYPWGHNKTVQRTWIETATKGAGKDQQRIMCASANKPWIYEYTKRIGEMGLETANDWARAEINAGRVPFCTPKASTYRCVIVLGLTPLVVDDAKAPNGRRELPHVLAVTHSSLTEHYDPEEFAEFEQLCSAHLNPDQPRLVELARQKAHYYGDRAAWVKWDAEHKAK